MKLGIQCNITHRTQIWSGCQTVSIVSEDNGCTHVLVVGGRTCPRLACFFVDSGHDKSIQLVTQLRYADKCFVNIMKEYIERNDLQLELIRYSIKC